MRVRAGKTTRVLRDDEPERVCGPFVLREPSGNAREATAIARTARPRQCLKERRSNATSGSGASPAVLKHVPPAAALTRTGSRARPAVRRNVEQVVDDQERV
jgi:hypothetical protein